MCRQKRYNTVTVNPLQQKLVGRSVAVSAMRDKTLEAFQQNVVDRGVTIQ